MLRFQIADPQGMFTSELHLLNENQDCLEILRAYADCEISAGEESDSNWTKRLGDQLDHAGGNDPGTEKSSEAHGLLIAYGYLDIELAGRSDGIQYRLSSDGKKALVMMEKQEKDQAASDRQRLAG